MSQGDYFGYSFQDAKRKELISVTSTLNEAESGNETQRTLRYPASDSLDAQLAQAKQWLLERSGKLQ